MFACFTLANQLRFTIDGGVGSFVRGINPVIVDMADPTEFAYDGDFYNNHGDLTEYVAQYDIDFVQLTEDSEADVTIIVP